MIKPINFPINRQANFLLKGPVGQLEVLTTQPESPRTIPAIAVICHPHPLFQGSLNNKVVTTLARSFDIMGFSTVRFNFRGVGKSQGRYDNGIGETNDLLAILQWLKISYSEHTVWLAGFSFGAYVAARGAKEWPVKQLICVAPPIENFPFKTLLPFPCPWILIQGDEDEIVSSQAVFSWIASVKDPPQLIAIKGASHFFHGHLITLREQLLNVLTNNAS
ncbi:MAG: CocE/NonD family hydrolase [Rickettsiella sp.]|nr:CocE/NonD family hydrolase [Rickettsiella sp.]